MQREQGGEELKVTKRFAFVGAVRMRSSWSVLFDRHQSLRRWTANGLSTFDQRPEGGSLVEERKERAQVQQLILRT